jgi:hypothetical protein
MGGLPTAATGRRMNTRTYFPYRIDRWDDQGNSIERPVAGVDDFETAMPTLAKDEDHAEAGYSCGAPELG